MRITEDFLSSFKYETENRWQHLDLNPRLYGFQFQVGTRWNPGLDDLAIREFECKVGVTFPKDFETLLMMMNGTDAATVNIYGNSGEPHRYSVGVYAYPRDIDRVLAMMKAVDEMRPELDSTLQEEGLTLLPGTKFVPIYAHRYVVCTKDTDVSTVVSIWNASDAIVYGKSLAEYLLNEFLPDKGDR